MKKFSQAILAGLAVLAVPVLVRPALVSSALIPPALAAAATPTPDEAKALCLKAASYVAQHGLKAAHAAFDQEGAFYHGELYAGILDFKGNWLVYPPKPAAEGANMMGVRDADGNYVAREIVAMAQGKGEGWVKYRFLDPADHKIEAKMTYVKRVPGTDLLTYVGVYTP